MWQSLSLVYLLLVTTTLAIEDWPQYNHDSGFTRNIANSATVLDYAPFSHPYPTTSFNLYYQPVPVKPIISPRGVLFYASTNAGSITAVDNSMVPPSTLWTYDPTQPPIMADEITVASLSLSPDGASLYAVFDMNQVSFAIAGINTITGQTLWWTTSQGSIDGEQTITAAPTAYSPLGWITISHLGFFDIVIPPALPIGQFDYMTQIRSRITLNQQFSYSPLLTLNGLHHMASQNGLTTQYKVMDEKLSIIAQTILPVPLQLVMVTPSNTGVFYHSASVTTYLAFLNQTSGQITYQSAKNLKPGAWLVDSNNPLKVPFMVFVRYDNSSQSAWLQVSPEPIFNTGVLWTVPTGLSFNQPFFFTTETAPMSNGLLPGIIYYQTMHSLIAVNMHNGETLWNYTLPTTTFVSASPIIGTVQKMSTKYFLYAMTVDNQNSVTQLNSMACCSGNGQCKLGSQVCSCFGNYFGGNCSVYCNISACNSQNTQGNTRGQCTATGCQCNTGFYGPLCQTECTPVATCNNHGTCSQNGTCVCKNANNFDFGVYSGPNCENKQLNYFFVGTIVAVALVVILLIVVFIISTKNRKPKKVRHHLVNQVD